MLDPDALPNTLSTADAEALFRESGALLSGHFVLTSGRHSDRYFEKFDVLCHPAHVERLARDLAVHVLRAGITVDVVLGPTTLGILLAYEVAKQLGARAAYGEKGSGGERVLRRPDHLPAGARVLVVDDVLTTGGSVRECIHLVAARGAVLSAVGVVVDRSGGAISFGVPLFGVLSMDVQSWAPDEVPEWLAALPVTRPGSTGKK